MTLKLAIKTTYGTPRFYPLNDTAKAVCKLTTTKTLTEGHLRVLRTMGMKIDIELAPSLERLLERVES